MKKQIKFKPDEMVINEYTSNDPIPVDVLKSPLWKDPNKKLIMKPKEKEIIEKFYDYLQKELKEYFSSYSSDAVWTWDVEKFIEATKEEYLK